MWSGNHDFDFGEKFPYPGFTDFVLRFIRISTLVRAHPGHKLRKRCPRNISISYPLSAAAQPWLLSNIVDTETNRVPEHLLEYVVLERLGARIGVIGLVEKCASDVQH